MMLYFFISTETGDEFKVSTMTPKLASPRNRLTVCCIRQRGTYSARSAF